MNVATRSLRNAKAMMLAFVFLIGAVNAGTAEAASAQCGAPRSNATNSETEASMLKLPVIRISPTTPEGTVLWERVVPISANCGRSILEGGSASIYLSHASLILLNGVAVEVNFTVNGGPFSSGNASTLVGTSALNYGANSLDIVRQIAVRLVKTSQPTSVDVTQLKTSIPVAVFGNSGAAAGDAYTYAFSLTGLKNIRAVPTTCAIYGGDGTDGAQDDISITLDRVSAELLTQGQSAGSKPFELRIGRGAGGDCDPGKIKAVTIKQADNAGNVDSATGNLKNTAADGAKNVQIRLMDDSWRKINVAASPQADLPTPQIIGSEGLVRLIAAYDAPAGNAGAGQVLAKAVYTIVYL